MTLVLIADGDGRRSDYSRRRSGWVTTIRVAAVLLAVASGVALHVVHAQQLGVKRTELQRRDLSVPGREVIQVRVDLDPGHTFPGHTHPGEEIIYVIEGTLAVRGRWQARYGQGRRRPVHSSEDNPLSEERRLHSCSRARNLCRRERTAAPDTGQVSTVRTGVVILPARVEQESPAMKFQHTAGVIGVASIFVVSVVAAGQDRFTLTSPNGVAFSEFKGYDVWQLVSPSNVDGGVKAILGNPVMMKAFSEGIPANGQPVPDGAVMAKIEWSSKDNSDLPGAAMVADTLKNVGFMMKDAKRFPETDGWGYAQFNYDVVSGAFKPLGSEPGFAKAACHQCHKRFVQQRDFVFTRYAPR